MTDLDILDEVYSKERLQTLTIPKQRDFLKRFLEAFEVHYEEHAVQAKATLAFQNLLYANDSLLLDAGFLERLLSAIPNPLSLRAPDIIDSVLEGENWEILEKTRPEFLAQLLSVIFSIWKQEPEALLCSFSYHLVLFCIDQQVITDPLEPFLQKLFAHAPEEWLLECWQALDTNFQLNARLYTETGKFNPFFKATKKKILNILDQIYRGIFSSELLKVGAKVYYNPDHDEYQGHISFHGRWEYKFAIPFRDAMGHNLAKKSLTVRLNEWDGGLTGNIFLSGSQSNEEDTQTIWDDWFLEETIYQQLNVVQRYLLVVAYAKNLVKLGFDTVLEVSLMQKEGEQAMIYPEEKPDLFFNCLQLKDSAKSREFARGFANEVINVVGQAGFDSHADALNKIYDLVK